MAEPTVQTTFLQKPLLQRSPERGRLGRRARLLAWGGIAYHFVEFAIALAGGIAASSIALIGFGADSLIEALAGFVVLWLFTGARIGSEGAERRAQLIGLVANAAAGLWWADPIAALFIAGVAIKEGREGWREPCCDAC
jgi:divalent metal cation (Fe/Co/Zn/Cd) transporter